MVRHGESLRQSHDKYWSNRGEQNRHESKKNLVSDKTVETYRGRIKEKLGLGNVTELVQRAAQWVLEKN
jgi:DNA-binding CsgD family transcriptional regulator